MGRPPSFLCVYKSQVAQSNTFPPQSSKNNPQHIPPQPTMPGADFQAAVKASRQLKAKPSNDELLELYALFKVANGEDISKAEAPGMFDLKGKAKQKAWQKEVDAGTSQADAEKRYVA